MEIDRKKLEKFLPKKGFKKETGRDHIFYYFYFNDKKTRAYTKISHSKKRPIDKGLLNSVRRELLLDDSSQAIDLCHCRMTHEQYIDILRQKGIV
jgi:hypothetical protein